MPSNRHRERDVSDDDQRMADDMALAWNVRKATIEACARELETSYPDHAWLNAACAAIRSMDQPKEPNEALRKLLQSLSPWQQR